MGRSIEIPEMKAYLEKIGYEFVGTQYVPLVPTSPPTTQLDLAQGKECRSGPGCDDQPRFTAHGQGNGQTGNGTLSGLQDDLRRRLARSLRRCLPRPWVNWVTVMSAPAASPPGMTWPLRGEIHDRPTEEVSPQQMGHPHHV